MSTLRDVIIGGMLEKNPSVDINDRAEIIEYVANLPFEERIAILSHHDGVAGGANVDTLKGGFSDKSETLHGGEWSLSDIFNWGGSSGSSTKADAEEVKQQLVETPELQAAQTAIESANERIAQAVLDNKSARDEFLRAKESSEELLMERERINDAIAQRTKEMKDLVMAQLLSNQKLSEANGDFSIATIRKNTEEKRLAIERANEAIRLAEEERARVAAAAEKAHQEALKEAELARTRAIEEADKQRAQAVADAEREAAIIEKEVDTETAMLSATTPIVVDSTTSAPFEPMEATMVVEAAEPTEDQPFEAPTTEEAPIEPTTDADAEAIAKSDAEAEADANLVEETNANETEQIQKEEKQIEELALEVEKRDADIAALEAVAAAKDAEINALKAAEKLIVNQTNQKNEEIIKLKEEKDNLTKITWQWDKTYNELLAASSNQQQQEVMEGGLRNQHLQHRREQIDLAFRQKMNDLILLQSTNLKEAIEELYAQKLEDLENLVHSSSEMTEEEKHALLRQYIAETQTEKSWFPQVRLQAGYLKQSFKDFLVNSDIDSSFSGGKGVDGADGADEISGGKGKSALQHLEECVQRIEGFAKRSAKQMVDKCFDAYAAKVKV